MPDNHADYALDAAKAQIEELLRPVCGSEPLEMKTPPPQVEGDLAVPLFRAAKALGKNPAALAGELAASLDLGGTLFSGASVTGGFLNFKLDEAAFGRRVLADFAERGKAYGRSELGAGKTVVVDYSSPNIAKPFSVGHLRSTVLGQAICNVLRFLGYTVVGDNHLGDWGTQFGKLLYAYDVWGDEAAVRAQPIQELLALYVKFHSEAEKDPAIEEAARGWFKRLETGDPRAVELWTLFRRLSLEEFERTYRLLGVEFDEVLGESFFNDRLEETVADAFAQGVAEWGEIEARHTEEGEPGEAASGEPRMEKVALIHLEKQGIDTPLLIQKSDGTSLYATRDLATVRYRQQRWQPEQIVYVVGAEQKLYFEQVFAAAKLLGIEARCVHVPFGLIRLAMGEGKMSTRRGKVIFLEDVLAEAIRRAAAILEERELPEDEKEEIARAVGIGAVKWADLSQTRTKEVVFDWDKMLNMQGDSAPYLQYATVRVRSIARKADEALRAMPADADLLTHESERALIRELARFPETVRAAADGFFPHLIAAYLIGLAREFSTFYKHVPVLRAESEPLAAARLHLCRMTAQVLETGLGLLGIDCPEKM